MAGCVHTSRCFRQMERKIACSIHVRQHPFPPLPPLPGRIESYSSTQNWIVRFCIWTYQRIQHTTQFYNTLRDRIIRRNEVGKARWVHGKGRGDYTVAAQLRGLDLCAYSSCRLNWFAQHAEITVCSPLVQGRAGDRRLAVCWLDVEMIQFSHFYYHCQIS